MGGHHDNGMGGHHDNVMDDPHDNDIDGHHEDADLHRRGNQGIQRCLDTIKTLVEKV